VNNEEKPFGTFFMNATILLIFENPSVRQSLTNLLEKEEYNLLSISAYGEFLAALEQEDIAVMIIEIDLSDQDGMDLVSQAQEISPDTEIVILTREGTMESAIRAIQLGVHDYLLKPSSEQEILSSVASAIGRQNFRKRKRILFEQLEKTLWELKDLYGIGEVVEQSDQVLRLPGGIKADLAQRKLWKGDKETYLTPAQGKLFKAFIVNWGQVLTHTELVFIAHGREVDECEAPEVLRPLISRMRKRLSVFDGAEKWIKTIRGTGYVFETLLPLDMFNEKHPLI
jgi:DNA-binding response OmpR family regulator